MKEKKIKLTVLGFSFNQTQSGTYGLVLGEDDGLRRLMIVVGAPEAQSIAFKLQNTEPPRPLTHDLFYSLMTRLNIHLLEVFIHKYDNGIFYSLIVFKQGNEIISIDSRTSDAIAIALRANANIYTTEKIMQTLSVVFSNSGEGGDNNHIVPANESTDDTDAYALLDKDELVSKLQDAISHEDYELAAILKKELDKRDNPES
jgi:bifunctional DNase/RNase